MAADSLTGRFAKAWGLTAPARAGAGMMVRDLRNLWMPLPGLSLAPSGPEVAQRIARVQFRTMFNEGPANLVATGAGLMLWWLGLYVTASGLPALLWAASNFLSMLAVVLTVTRFVRTKPPDDELRRWEVVFGRCMLLTGSTWGILPFVTPSGYASYVAIGLLLILAGSLSAFINYRPGISWFSVPCVVLIPVALASDGGLLNLLVGVGFLVASILLIRLATAQSALVTRAMQNAEERLALLQELEARRQEAQHANQAKTRFLAAASHDLRQPIYSIALLTDVLARRPGSDDSVLGQITASVEVMDSMLSALLEVSRLDVGALPLNLAPFPLAPLLDRSKLQFEAQAVVRGIRLEVRCGGDWWVASDIHQLQRIVANLVSNAVHFTRLGGVLIRCRRRGDRVWIQVWDSGVGIARQDQGRIFGEFVQITEHASVGARQGIGLGLSIVQRLAQRLGCPMRLHSRPGRGSVFSLGVPLHAQAPLPLSADEAAAATAPSLESLLAGQLVLLIDDDEQARGSMRTLLEACQCHVLACGSTAEALAEAERSLRIPDLIISDYRLGRGDNGLDAIARVREALEDFVPSVLVTAELQMPHEAAARLGVAVLGKPLKPRALAACVARLL
jgi:two-component system, sensor histidine kinase